MNLRKTFENTINYELSKDDDGISLSVSDILIPMLKVAPFAVLMLSAVYLYTQSENNQFNVQDEFSTPFEPRP